MRDVIDERSHGIYMHVATDLIDLVWLTEDTLYRIPELEKSRAKEKGEKPPLCRAYKETLRFCLTDYTITIERAEVHETFRSRSWFDTDGVSAINTLYRQKE